MVAKDRQISLINFSLVPVPSINRSPTIKSTQLQCRIIIAKVSSYYMVQERSDRKVAKDRKQRADPDAKKRYTNLYSP